MKNKQRKLNKMSAFSNREIIDDMRNKKVAIEEAYTEINNTKAEILSICENINYIKEIASNLNDEIQLRRQNLSNLLNQYESIYKVNSESSKGGSFFQEIKEKLIRKQMEKVLSTLIPIHSPEVNLKMEFNNLMFNSVTVSYRKYKINENSEVEKDDSASFFISKFCSFRLLKSQACAYWCLDNESEYLFTDINEGIIYNEDVNIDQYFKSYSVLSDRVQLISASVLKSRINLKPQQLSALRHENKSVIKKDKGLNNMSAVNESNKDNQINQEIKRFFNDYPALNQYVLHDNTSKNKIKILPKNIETSFFMLLLLILFYIMNIYFIYNSRDIQRDFINVELLDKIFDNSNVSTYQDLKNYLVYTVGKFLLDADPPTTIQLPLTNPFDYNNEVINNFGDERQQEALRIAVDTYYINFLLSSSIHLIINNANNAPVNENMSKEALRIFQPIIKSKYYPLLNTDTTSKVADEVSEYTINIIKNSTRDYFKGFLNLTNYKTAKEAEVNLFFKGLNGEYDGSGFHADIQGSTPFLLFKDVVDRLFPNETSQYLRNGTYAYIIGPNTRSFFLIFTLYFVGPNTWANVLLPFEFLANSRIKCHQIQARMFMPTIYRTGSVIFCDVLRFIFVLVLFFFLSVELFEKRQALIEDPLNTISVKMLLSIFIAICYLVSFILKLKYCLNPELKFFDNNRSIYTDTFMVSYQFNNIFFIESLLFAAVSLKILDFLQLNDYIKLFFNSIDLGFSRFSKYMLIITCVYLFYASICMIVWGPFIEEYSSFGNAFIQLFLMSMGYYDISNLVRHCAGWGITILLSFFLVVIIFLFTAFISLYAESLRNVVTKLGYPEDEELNQWTLKDYIIWLCYCIKTDDEENKISN